MGKIGMLTFHRTNNFGSVLQTYGLYKKIIDLGYECEIIDYRCPAIEYKEKLKIEWHLTKPKEIVKNILFQPTLNKKASSLQKFIADNMNMGNMYTPDTISRVEQNYSKIIVGSDIVWGRDITQNDYTYFLDFIKDNKKKFAFASSVGDYTIRGDEERLKILLSDFEYIAVREEEAVDWVRRVSGKKAEWVCDPTMLLLADEWKKVIPLKKIVDDYVLVYFNTPDGKCLKSAIEYAKKYNKKVYFINYGLQIKGVIRKRPTSLEEFLSLIANANMVFTASYHGMLFSIYFHKRFMFYTRAHKSRMISLAKYLSLEDCCGDEKKIDEFKDIDYVAVEQRVKEFRDNSILVLNRMLVE